MKKAFAFIFLLIPFTLLAQEMNIMTFNIRLNTPADGENAWPNRVTMVNGLLDYYDADIFGLQEAFIGQIKDVEGGLPGFEWIGVGRDDGDKAGEFSPLFFNTAKFILLDNGHFWLSENCDKPGLGWDAACNRIVIWGKFQSKVSGKKFFVFNTHFDHQGVEARKNSALLIRDKIKEIARNSGFPVILMGDFNLTPESEPIAMIKKYMADSRELSEEPPFGPIGTFQGFKMDAPMKDRIDYVFVNSKVKVLKYGVLADFKDHRFPSDHFPVLVKIVLK
ncbi:endonuclease/exonuclease/phosphatase family protein [Maribellus sp. YY47]|uniref:endonuclease/exonuclease/phosphatase family protein n=1 Tax=Maribellus sp. YY47 TaxID=2929486 RepID=UPI002001645F|nr:endonuclease/exonuclease/phosphatase family protein [Maribellus sp. YY47]MCK3683005.1 endonuclease/exonuclease/phosphatase family protein [Maribellus sp. YY47]